MSQCEGARACVVVSLATAIAIKLDMRQEFSRSPVLMRSWRCNKAIHSPRSYFCYRFSEGTWRFENPRAIYPGRAILPKKDGEPVDLRAARSSYKYGESSGGRYCAE